MAFLPFWRGFGSLNGDILSGDEVFKREDRSVAKRDIWTDNCEMQYLSEVEVLLLFLGGLLRKIGFYLRESTGW